MAFFSQMIKGVGVLLLILQIGNVFYGAHPVYEERVNTISYSAVSEDEIQRRNEYVWIIKIENGYYYKRLYNTNTNQWVGDWILVGPV